MTISIKSVLFALFFGLSLFFIPTNVRADQIAATNCTEDEYTQSGIFTLPAGNYEVYISSDLSSGTARVYANQYDNLDPASCVTISENTVFDKGKRRFGNIIVENQRAVTWYVKTDQPASTKLSANRIKITLVPIGLDICIKDACSIDETTTLTIQPVQSNAASNSIIIAYYLAPALDILSEVDYYADNIFLFSKQAIEPFPDEYRSAGTYSTLTTLSRYRSGQLVIQNEDVRGTVDALSVVGFYKLYINPIVIRLPVLGAVVGLVVFIYLLLLSYRAIYKKRRWNYAHGFWTEKTITIDQDKVIKRIKRLDSWLEIKKPLYASAILIATLLLINIFMFDLYSVSGHSMDTTLKDKQKVIIYKLPVFVKRFFGGNYVPDSGSIVVARVNQTEGAHTSTFGNGKMAMIKRVVATAGDRVVVKDNVISVYKNQSENAINFDLDSTWEQTMISTDDPYSIDYVLGLDEVFLVGDNRDASIDSRINGPVNTNQIIGVLVYEL